VDIQDADVNTVTTVDEELGDNAKRPIVRVEYLDGVRGLAALGVLLSHEQGQCHSLLLHDLSGHLSKIARLLISPFADGEAYVSMFIVLSGYCLTLPLIVGQSSPRKLDIAKFAYRRSRRIIPPYYAALALSLLLIYLVPELNQKTGTFWDVALPAFGTGDILTHIFLVHNLVAGYYDKIDPPMWSVGPEWQIYYIFALVLLPLWRKLNIWIVLAAALILSYVPYAFAQQTIHFGGSQMVFTFSVGMLAAIIGFGNDVHLNKLASSPVWLLVIVLSLPVIIYIQLHSATESPLAFEIQHVFHTLVALSILVICTRSVQRNEDNNRNGFVNLCESRFARRLGIFSYSLYLIHSPILELFFIAFRRIHLAPVPTTCLVFLCATPIICGLAYLFHLAFERPFLHRTIQRPH